MPIHHDFASHMIGAAAANPRGAVNTVVRSAGRMVGISGDDMGAVQQTGFPIWVWLVVGGLAGFVGGVWVVSKHGDKVPSWMPGRGGGY